MPIAPAGDMPGDDQADAQEKCTRHAKKVPDMVDIHIKVCHNVSRGSRHASCYCRGHATQPSLPLMPRVQR